MNVTVEEPQNFRQAISATAKLAFARLTIKWQERKIRDLECFATELEARLNEMKKAYTELNHDRDVLQGIGIERREDGAWVFNFVALLSRMSHEDHDEIRRCLKWRS